MPIEVHWGNEAKTYFVFEFIGDWGWEEYYEGRKKGTELMNEVPHSVNVLVDYTRSAAFPANMLSHFGSSIDKAPKEFGYVVIAADSPFVAAIVNVLGRLKKRQLVAVRTREEARQIMQEYDTQRTG
jgi:hypothetical protein